MSNERDELARDIFYADNWLKPESELAQDWEHLVKASGRVPTYAHYIADGLIAKSYRKPRTVTTAEELDALPEGTLLLASGTYYDGGTFTDCHARIVPAFVHGTDELTIEVLIYGGSDLAKTITFPATVLHEGPK